MRPYWVYFQIPRLPRLTQIDNDFLKLQSQLFKRNIHALGVGANLVIVEYDFRHFVAGGVICNCLVGLLVCWFVGWERSYGGVLYTMGCSKSHVT